MMLYYEPGEDQVENVNVKEVHITIHMLDVTKN